MLLLPYGMGVCLAGLGRGGRYVDYRFIARLTLYIAEKRLRETAARAGPYSW